MPPSWGCQPIRGRRFASEGQYQGLRDIFDQSSVNRRPMTHFRFSPGKLTTTTATATTATETTATTTATTTNQTKKYGKRS